jgi:DNA invertase Pin-like site-specific DNA recombinase
MAEPPKTRAAQYLRMSTEHQRYSLAAQAQAIAEYAAANGYEINRTYFDPRESGITFENRLGLQALLSAALDPSRAFQVVLVLDVTRWGRFQDIDQPAHYEYLCRSAGVRVIYCGEPFRDDDTPVSSLLKTLKRIMAAEFSRELSGKVKRARLQQALLGFYQGGVAVYGVRRIVVDPEGRPRLELGPGERKALASDRVVLRAGPSEEQAVMRGIFRRFVRDERGPTTIARELNARGVASVTGRPWRHYSVESVLRNELAIGRYVINKTDRTLNTPARPRPAGEWLRVRAFEPIVSPTLFRQAQERLRLGERERLSKPEMLKALRRLWRQHGRLSSRLLDRSAETPVSESYRARFGSLWRAYELIGYTQTRPKRLITAARRQAMLVALRDAYHRHGHITSSLIDADRALPKADTYRRHFGSLLRAYELAGLPHAYKDLMQAGCRRWACKRRRSVSDAELLAALRELNARGNGVSRALLQSAPDLPGPWLYERRFGSLTAAYGLAGLPQDLLRRGPGATTHGVVSPSVGAAGQAQRSGPCRP